MSIIKPEEIKTILIIGAGTMGLRIGLQAAMSEYNVTMYDISEKSLEKALKTQDTLLRSLAKEGRVKQEDMADIKARITTTTDPATSVQNADLVSESVLEDVSVKNELYTTFAPLFPKHTIITTNTSYMLASMFAEISGAPERFCAWHYHNIFHANVVDIMPHAEMDPAVTDTLMVVSKRLNQIPVVVHKENHGYLFNTMLMALLGAAGDLRTRDVASIEDIDRSWIGNFKMEVGPFGIFDSIGLDTAWHVVKAMPDKKSQRFAELLKTYVDEGKLGIKTGEGFYKYPNPAFQREGFLMGE